MHRNNDDTRTLRRRHDALAVFFLGALLALGLSACATAQDRFATLNADELFRVVQAEYAEEDWDATIQAAEQFLASHPRDSRLVEVRLLLARGYYGREEYITAAAEFDRTLARYPTSPLAAEAAFGVCQSHAALSPIPQRDQEYTELALDTCARVIADYPGTAEAREASRIRDSMLEKLAEKLLQNGDFYMRRGLYDSSVVYYEAIVREYPGTSVAPRALLQMVEAYGRIGYDDEAAEARERLLSQYPDSPEAQRLAGGVPRTR